MKLFIISFISLFSSFSFSADFVFNNARVNDVISFYYKSIKKENYVLMPDVPADSKKVSVNLVNVSEFTIDSFFNSLLKSTGLVSVKNGDSWLISSSSSSSSASSLSSSSLSSLSSQVSPPPFPPTPALPFQKDSSLNVPFNSIPSNLNNNNNINNNSIPDLDDLFIYFPKHRSIESIYPIISKVFPNLIDRNNNQDFVVLNASKSKHKKINDFLNKIDLPVPQLLISAHVYEVSASESKSNAISLFASLFKSKLGFSLDSVSFPNQISFKSGDFSAVISALDSDSRFTSVSSPVIRVESGVSAKFSSGSDVPVLDSIQESQSGSTRQSIVYRPSGVIFDVFPRVFDLGYSMTVTQQLSNFTQTKTGVSNSPTLQKRELKTSFSASFDDVIVLGGLKDFSGSGDKTGVSFLPDIMSSKSKSSFSKEFLLIISVQKI